MPNPRVYTHTHKNDHVRTLNILQSVSEFGVLRKHEKTQHALNNNNNKKKKKNNNNNYNSNNNNNNNKEWYGAFTKGGSRTASLRLLADL